MPTSFLFPYTNIEKAENLTVRRKRYAARVAKRNYLMPTPCKNYRLAKLTCRCLVNVSLGNCSKCLAQGLQTCDLVVSKAD